MAEAPTPRPARLALEFLNASWIRRTAVALILFVVLIELAELAPGLRRLNEQADKARAVPLADRPLAGARSVDIDRTFLHQAKALIPANATFAVVTGPQVQVSTPLTLQALPAYAQFWLLPRRKTDLATAQWLLCFGCDPAKFGPRLKVVWHGEEGSILIGRLGP